MSFYQLYELNHAAMAPWRALADATRLTFQNPFNPLADTTLGRSVAAAAELFERTTRRYGKPEFGLSETEVDGTKIAVTEEIVWSRPFCSLLHFRRDLPQDRAPDPKLLIVAPLSGHYATLLRGTVEAMLPDHEVFITDWNDARMVPLSEGTFDLDDYIDYVIGMLRHLGRGTHVMAVCQPSVPVLAAAALMNEDGDPDAPASMTLMGGPIDTRRNPTAVNRLAEEKGIDWFRQNVVMPVPFPHPGFMRHVYPGFLQLSGFMSMNLDRHVSAHRDMFMHLVRDDGDSAEKHREFYDEYLAVMDLTAEFYLQTVDAVFVRHALPKGELTHRGRPVRPEAITRTALLTVEGERDDISGVGQTEAAQDLCSGLPAAMKEHYLQPKVGHYGVFNGSRYRSEIQPRIAAFIRAHGGTGDEPFAQDSAVMRRRNDLFRTLSQGYGFAALDPSNLPSVVKDMADTSQDLTQISGIGQKMAEELNRLGIYQVEQLAELSDDALQSLDANGSINGRASRFDWSGQARKIVGEQLEEPATGFS